VLGRDRKRQSRTLINDTSHDDRGLHAQSYLAVAVVDTWLDSRNPGARIRRSLAMSVLGRAHRVRGVAGEFADQAPDRRESDSSQHDHGKCLARHGRGLLIARLTVIPGPPK